MPMIALPQAPKPLQGPLSRLVRCASGVALTEFAFAAPFLIAIGLAGLEITNMALTNLRVSQMASNLADVMSRAGVPDGSGQKVIRERDINDAFAAIARQGGSAMDMVNNGRIVVSSLELNSAKGNWIHWQRCHGTLKKGGTLIASAYGNQGRGQVNDPLGAFAGMGTKNDEVVAPEASAVMFVEVYYDYQPLVSNRFFGGKTLRSESAFLVRDRRVLTDADNPQPTTGLAAKTC